MDTTQPPRAGVKVGEAVCGRELTSNPDPDICGKPATVWVLFDGDDWDGDAASACAEHADELLAFPHRVSSDAPFDADDCY